MGGQKDIMASDTQPMNPLYFNRTVSHIIRMFAIPEIEKRIASGSITEANLPLEIKQFRAIQKKSRKEVSNLFLKSTKR